MFSTPVGVELDRVRYLPQTWGASAIAALSDSLLIVHDDRGIFRVWGERGSELWAGRDLHDDLGDLEGLATNEDRNLVWAVSERRGTVLSLPLKSSETTVTTVGRLARPGTHSKKGYEGLAFLPARFSPSGRDSLVAVHEGKPRRVGVFALPELDQTHEFKLGRQLKDLLDDLADVTVDPISGALLLLSDESQRIAVVRIDGERLALIFSVNLPLDKDDKPEGIDFASSSSVLVVTDNAPKILYLHVVRRRVV